MGTKEDRIRELRAARAKEKDRAKDEVSSGGVRKEEEVIGSSGGGRPAGGGGESGRRLLSVRIRGDLYDRLHDPELTRGRKVGRVVDEALARYLEGP